MSYSYVARGLSMAVVGLAFAGGSSASADTLTFDVDNDYLVDGQGWDKDRFPPEGFKAEDGVLKHSIAPPPVPGETFRNSQGMKYTFSPISGAVQEMAIQMFVDSAWSSSDVSAGFWGVGLDATNVISAYPIIAYRAGDADAYSTAEMPATPGFYTWDYSGYVPATGSPDVNVDGWNSLLMRLTVGQGVDYFVNGTMIGSVADTDTVRLSQVILNAYNNGSSYTVQWDNFSAAAVPLPAAAWAGFALMGGMGLVRKVRGRKQMA